LCFSFGRNFNMMNPRGNEQQVPQPVRAPHCILLELKISVSGYGDHIRTQQVTRLGANFEP
jgi:hypothetical protein